MLRRIENQANLHRTLEAIKNHDASVLGRDAIANHDTSVTLGAGSATQRGAEAGYTGYGLAGWAMAANDETAVQILGQISEFVRVRGMHPLGVMLIRARAPSSSPRGEPLPP